MRGLGGVFVVLGDGKRLPYPSLLCVGISRAISKFPRSASKSVFELISHVAI